MNSPELQKQRSVSRAAIIYLLETFRNISYCLSWVWKLRAVAFSLRSKGTQLTERREGWGWGIIKCGKCLQIQASECTSHKKAGLAYCPVSHLEDEAHDWICDLALCSVKVVFRGRQGKDSRDSETSSELAAWVTKQLLWAHIPKFPFLSVNSLDFALRCNNIDHCESGLMSHCHRSHVVWSLSALACGEKKSIEWVVWKPASLSSPSSREARACCSCGYHPLPVSSCGSKWSMI